MYYIHMYERVTGSEKMGNDCLVNFACLWLESSHERVFSWLDSNNQHSSSSPDWILPVGD